MIPGNYKLFCRYDPAAGALFPPKRRFLEITKLSLSSMFETKCYRQNDRSDRVIISWFWWKSEFGMVLTSQIYVLYTKHNLPIFFIIDLFLCKWWKIQALLPLWSCRRRSFFPQKGASWKKQHVISEKMRLYLWIQPPEVPGPVPGGVKCSQVPRLRTKSSQTEFSAQSTGSTGSRGSGVSNCGSDPPFHARRGPGWR